MLKNCKVSKRIGAGVPEIDITEQEKGKCTRMVQHMKYHQCDCSHKQNKGQNNIII